MYDFESIHLSTSVDDAVAALAADPEAIIISAGTDVLVQIREGRHAGCRLVSIHNLPELRGIRMCDDGTIEIGAACTFREIHEDPIVAEHLQALCMAADTPGGPQLRAVGTIGGNVCNGITSADTASSVVAYDAVMRVRGPKGDRDIPVSEWYTGPGRTSRAHDEVLVCIRFPRAGYEGFAGTYYKYGKREALEIATMGVSCLVKMDADRARIADIRLAFGVAGPYPKRAVATEDALRGLAVDEAVATVGDLACEEMNPRTSWRASKEFRLQLIAELSRRLIRETAIKGGADA
ncbi:xanthine dehydrogenase subunit XdhB [Collinsella ihumii]|uniref:Xanthine dehydrogenase FAD-binding subunit XdhB n=1 Tax=Collinsella ihumii TaxID=1720204 RepID=A0AAW7JWB1_9ACTN|nr:xanthine dehydrogenase subunit XdhB [Collinsella ihumii]MDN0069123.1 xanthine dehydrogenase FAD-binding subunit XdhB [Collinsella ihumii]